MDIKHYLAYESYGKVVFITQNLRGLAMFAYINPKVETILCVGYLNRLSNHIPKIEVLTGDPLAAVQERNIDFLCIEDRFEYRELASIIYLYKNSMIGGKVLGPYLDIEIIRAAALLNKRVTLLGKRGWVLD